MKLKVGDIITCKKNFYLKDGELVCIAGVSYEIFMETKGLLQLKDKTNQNVYLDSSRYYNLPYVWDYFYKPEELVRETRKRKLNNLNWI